MPNEVFTIDFSKDIQQEFKKVDDLIVGMTKSSSKLEDSIDGIRTILNAIAENGNSRIFIETNADKVNKLLSDVVETCNILNKKGTGGIAKDFDEAARNAEQLRSALGNGESPFAKYNVKELEQQLSGLEIQFEKVVDTIHFMNEAMDSGDIELQQMASDGIKAVTDEADALMKKITETQFLLNATKGQPFNEDDWADYYNRLGDQYDTEIHLINEKVAAEEKAHREKLARYQEEDKATKESIERAKEGFREYERWWEQTTDQSDTKKLESLERTFLKIQRLKGRLEVNGFDKAADGSKQKGYYDAVCQSLIQVDEKMQSILANNTAIGNSTDFIIKKKEEELRLESELERKEAARVERVEKEAQRLAELTGTIDDNGRYGKDYAMLSFGYEDQNKLAEKVRSIKKAIDELNKINGDGRYTDYINKASREVANLELRIDSAKAATKQFDKSAQFVKSTFASLASAGFMTGLIKRIVDVRGEFEMAEKSIGIIIHDAEKANDIFNDIQSIAVKSPFNVSDLVKQTKQLAAYRIETDKLVETTKMLGDIASGVGVDMNRLILAYGQVKAAGVLKGTELRQFSEAGVNLLGGLSDKFSEIYNRAVSAGEVLQMIQKKMVTFEDVDDVLRQQTQFGGTFYKMQEQQAETVKGMISNLKDSFEISLNQMGKSSDAFIKGIIKLIGSVLKHWKLVEYAIVSSIAAKIIPAALHLLIKSFGGAIATVTRFRDVLVTTGAEAVVFKTILAGLKSVVNLLGGVGVVAAATGAAATMWLLNWASDQRRLNKLVASTSNEIEKNADEYRTLSHIAADTAASERDRVKAIDELKQKYGNILPIQDLELKNAKELLNVEEQHINMLRNYSLQQARAQEEARIVDELNQKADKRTNQLWRSEGLDTLINQYRKEIPGLALIEKSDVNNARAMVEQDLIKGVINDSTEARDEFLKIILSLAGASEQQMNTVIDSLGSHAYLSISSVFDVIDQKMSKVDDKFGSEGFDMSIPKSARRFQKIVESLKDASKEFSKTRTQAQLDAYEINPPKRDYDFQEFLDQKKQSILDTLDKEDIGGEVLEKLHNNLETIYNDQSVLSGPVSKIVNGIFMELNDEFQEGLAGMELIAPLGSGLLQFESDKDIDVFGEKLEKFKEQLLEARKVLYPGDGAVGNMEKDPRVAAVVMQWGGASRTVESAGGRILHQLELIEAAEAALGIKTKEMAQEEANYVTNMEQFFTDMFRVFQSLDELTEDEIERLDKELTGKALEFNFDFEKNQTVLSTLRGDWDDFQAWVEKNIIEKVPARFQQKITLQFGKQFGNMIKEQHRGVASLGQELISTASNWGTYSEEAKEAMMHVLEDTAVKWHVDMPDDMSFEAIQAWAERNRQMFDEATWWRFEFNLFSAMEQQEEQNKKDAAARAKQVSSDTKQLISDVRQGIKEMDKLDEKGKELLEKKIRLSANDLHVKFDGLDNIDDLLMQLETKLQEHDYVDIMIDINKEEAEDRINSIKASLDALWDKYGTAKSANELGIRIVGYDASDIYKQIEKEEQRLLEEGTEDAVDAANENKRKRLDVFRNEQEEAMKLIHDSLIKEKEGAEKIYAEMIEDVTKMQDAFDSRGGISLHMEDVANGISARVAKAFDDVQKSQWEAYKGTQMYAMAFGDLGNIGNDVLMSLKADLEEWSLSSSLSPTDVRSVRNAIKNIDEQISIGDAKGFFGAIKEGLRGIANAKEAMEKTPDLEYAANVAINMRRMAKEAYDEARSASEEYNNTHLAAAGAAYDAAREKLKNLTEGSDGIITTEMYAAAVKEVDNAEMDFIMAQAESNRLIEFANELYIAYERAVKKASDASGDFKDNQERIAKWLDKSSAKLNAIGEAYSSVGKLIDNTVNYVNDLGEAFGFALGDETQEYIEAFQKGFAMVGSTISLVSSAMTTCTTVMKALETAGLAAQAAFWPLLAIGAVLGGIAVAIKVSDNRIKHSIENIQSYVDSLEESYERLTEAMQKSLTTASTRQNYEATIANLELQRQKVLEMRELEKSRGNKADDDALSGYDDKLKELNDQIKETKDSFIELMGAPSDYGSVADDWASSWLSKFKEVGDGLEALDESFDSMYDGLVEKQLSKVVLGEYAEKLQTMISDALAGDGYITEMEAEAIRGFKDTLRGAQDRLVAQADRLGIEIGNGGSDDDTLQKGIQSVTESTASAIESYLNSMRYYQVDSNASLKNIEALLRGTDVENPMLNELKAQTSLLQNIRDFIDSVRKPGHSQGGFGLKVII